jgi:hypothetical protein
MQKKDLNGLVSQTAFSLLVTLHFTKCCWHHSKANSHKTQIQKRLVLQYQEGWFLQEAKFEGCVEQITAKQLREAMDHLPSNWLPKNHKSQISITTL